MEKIIGLMTVHNAEKFVGRAIDQAVEICDEVLVAVGPHHSALEGPDNKNARKAIDKYGDAIKAIAPCLSETDAVTGKCDTLNAMLQQSSCFDIGNYLWILDVDEFYDDAILEEIMDAIANGEEMIDMSSKYFLINMQHYVKTKHRRIFKINEKSYFTPTQHWHGRVSSTYLTQNDMFHYSGLLDWRQKLKYWRCEYAGNDQQRKIDWLEKVYLRYDLDNETKSLDRAEEIMGYRQPFLSENEHGDENGELYLYDGEHQWFKDSELTKITDYRNLYYK